MTRETRLTSDEWHRLETSWEMVVALAPDEHGDFVESLGADPVVQGELKSLLAGLPQAEALFDHLQDVVSHEWPAHVLLDEDPDEETIDGLAPSAADSLIGAMVNQYRIESLLGEGGMGLVYRAIDTRLGRTVALKLLRRRPGGDLLSKDRLLAEARAAAALDHANICSVHEVGETAEHTWFIAMTYYSGETLDRTLLRGALPVDIALNYATQVARGLAAAHERGIIHRDVKPANIIVTDEGVVKLLDFGVARRSGDGNFFSGVTPGTIAYMSPEQLALRPTDHRTDLWSLGVVLFELCTGTRPFHGEDVGATVQAILQDSPRVPPMPADVGAIVDQLLSKDPTLRYPTATALIADLTRDRAAAGRRSTRSRTRRRRVVAIATSLFLLVLPWTPPAESKRGEGALLSDRRMAAIDLYNQGHVDRLFRTDSGILRAMEFFRNAVAIDSTYAPARAGVAHMLLADTRQSGRRERLDTAETHARQAVAFDSAFADAHAALGRVLMQNYRFSEAEVSLKRAFELLPKKARGNDLSGRPEYAGEFLVWLYVFMGRPRDAMHYAELNERANPRSPTAIAEVARALIVNGRCDEAMQVLGSLASLDPPPARVPPIAAQCYAQRQMWQKAVDVLRAGAASRGASQAGAWLGFMLARAGQTAEAHEIRDRLLEHANSSVGAYQLVTIYAGLREYDKAFEWLDRAVEDRSLTFTIMEPAFEELRRDPRFDRLRERLGIHKRDG